MHPTIAINKGNPDHPNPHTTTGAKTTTPTSISVFVRILHLRKIQGPPEL